MHADVVIDHEFQTCQTHAFVRNLAEVECQLWVAHIHHDFGGNLRQFATFNFRDFHVKDAFVHFTFIAFRARHGHKHAVFQHIGRIRAANNRWYAQFTRDDRSMTGATTTVGDDRCRTFHHGLPVRVGHVGNQDVTRLYSFHFRWIHDHAHCACTNFLTDRTTCCQYVCAAFERVAHFGFATLLALDRFWTCLQNVNFTVVTVFAPFDVHWTTVMFLDDDRVFGELIHIGIGD